MLVHSDACKRLLSASGNDGAACTSSAPCKSVQRGFQVAQAGQTITLGAGEYGTQELQNAHKAVTFKGGGAAHFTNLSLTWTTGINARRDRRPSSWTRWPGTTALP